MPKINLSQYQFTLRDPYQAGHVMTDLEANVLNYHRADNIRKIVTRWMAEAERDAPDGVLTIAKLDELIVAIAQLDYQYELSHREAPKLPAFDHQLRTIALEEVSKDRAAHLIPDYEERIEAAMRDYGNRARARRTLVSHMNTIYEDQTERSED